MKAMYDWHCQHYPLMEPQDVVKLYFQAMLGCGHLLANEASVTQRIEQEEAHLIPAPDEPLTESLGKDYVRLNLRRAMAEGISPLWIAGLMSCSPQPTNTREQVVQAVTAAGNADAAQIAQRLLTEPNWLPGHSDAYRQAYAPAYRVIGRQCAALLPLLTQIAKLPVEQRTLICIDGPSGSGKTTLAKLLQQVLDAAVIPMDDFFLPHARKTAERLSQPGGNADWERVVEECITPWAAHKPITYRPYDCHRDAFAEAVTLPDKRFTLVEGSYSLLPCISRYAALRVFLRVSPEEQQRRTLARNGAAGLQAFQQRWIPLEQAYFAAFQLPDEGCTVLSSAEQDL